MTDDILRDAVEEVIARLRDKNGERSAMLGPEDRERMADHLEKAMRGERV